MRAPNLDVLRLQPAIPPPPVYSLTADLVGRRWGQWRAAEQRTYPSTYPTRVWHFIAEQPVPAPGVMAALVVRQKFLRQIFSGGRLCAQVLGTVAYCSAAYLF